MDRSRAVTVFGALALVLSGPTVAACHPEEPTSPSVGLTKSVDPPKAPDLGRGAPRGNVRVLYNIWMGDPIRDVCKGPSPFFEFDSSETGASDQSTMKVLSTCMTEGPLKGKSIVLIGHTDPRGTANYNEQLGLERAQRVKRYLVAHGVDSSRISVETAGEDSAHAAPAEWARDRRVEIQPGK